MGIGVSQIKHVKLPASDLRCSATCCVTGVDIPDPDGTIIRIVWHDPIGMSGFLGVEYDAEGRPRPYREPRLAALDQPK